MERTIIDNMTPKTLENLVTQLNFLPHFYAEIDKDKDLNIHGKNGYLAIPVSDITSYELTDITVTIRTPNLTVTLWRNVEYMHMVAFNVKEIEKSARKLIRGYKRRHRNTTPARCDVCGKEFKNAQGVATHKGRGKCIKDVVEHLNKVANDPSLILPKGDQQ